MVVALLVKIFTHLDEKRLELLKNVIYKAELKELKKKGINQK